MMAHEKQRICFVIPEYRGDSPTHFSYVYDMLRELSSAFQIRCIIERSFGNPTLPDGVEVYAQRPTPFLFRVAQTKINILCARAAGYRDFYIHYSFFSAFFASLLARIFGGRVFYWNCGLPWQYRRNWFRERFEQLVYQMVTFLVTGTEGLKREYAKHYKIPLEKIKVIPNWIDIAKVKSQSASWRTKIKIDEIRKQLNIPEGARILLFVHRLSKRKGAHYIPEIMNRLRDENVFLVVVGDGPEMSNLKLEISNLKLENHIRLIGAVPQNEVIKYFSIADIFIMPSEEEGFPHVLLEAMAAGIPFVAFDVGGVTEITPPELKNDTVPSEDIGLFCRQIYKILSQADRYRDILQSHAEKYDSKKVAFLFKEPFEAE